MCGSEIDIVQSGTNKIVSYTRESQDRIVHERVGRSYRIRQIVSYMGFGVRKKEIRNDAVQCVCVVK